MKLVLDMLVVNISNIIQFTMTNYEPSFGRENFLKFFEISKLWIIIHSFIKFLYHAANPDKGRGGLMWGLWIGECTGGEGRWDSMEPCISCVSDRISARLCSIHTHYDRWKVTVLSVKKQLWDVKTPEPRLILLRLCAITVTNPLTLPSTNTIIQGDIQAQVHTVRATESECFICRDRNSRPRIHNLLVANTCRQNIYSLTNRCCDVHKILSWSSQWAAMGIIDP